jgi:hypothetical protein
MTFVSLAVFYMGIIVVVVAAVFVAIVFDEERK